MKKCEYCGREYPDDVSRCAIDNELLPGGNDLVSSGGAAIAILASPVPNGLVESIDLPSHRRPWTDRQLHIIEVLLVCLIAFGGSMLTSGYHFWFGYGAPSSGNSDSETFKWVYNALRQASALALVWYLLLRRGKSFSDLGLVWSWKDAGWAVLLCFAGTMAYRLAYDAMYFTGLTSTSLRMSGEHVGSILFGGGVFFATILFQFLNPFFEELIVRAYVMTEVKFLTNSLPLAIIISTVLQTSYHFYQGAPAALALGATFLIFSLYYAKTNRITPVVLAHLYTDVNSTLWYMHRHG